MLMYVYTQILEIKLFCLLLLFLLQRRQVLNGMKKAPVLQWNVLQVLYYIAQLRYVSSNKPTFSTYILPYSIYSKKLEFRILMEHLLIASRKFSVHIFSKT